MLVCMLLQDMLADLGCHVVGPVARVDEALALIYAETFDAAVLDVNLHGQPSYPVADALSAQSAPFVFATGYIKLQNGYDSVPRLQKPVLKKELEAALVALLAHQDGE